MLRNMLLYTKKTLDYSENCGEVVDVCMPFFPFSPFSAPAPPPSSFTGRLK